MIPTAVLYQSILQKLSTLPVEYLENIDQILTNFSALVREREKDSNNVMQFAGMWSDMTDEDFEDYLSETRKVRKELFNRDIDANL